MFSEFASSALVMGIKCLMLVVCFSGQKYQDLESFSVYMHFFHECCGEILMKQLKVVVKILSEPQGQKSLEQKASLTVQLSSPACKCKTVILLNKRYTDEV